MSDTTRYSSGEDAVGDSKFADYIAAERARLTAERDQILSDQENLQRSLNEINREFDAIQAYESHKSGRRVASAVATNGHAPRTRARRGSQREALLELIRSSDGLKRGEILDRMGLRGDKSGEMSVSNALTALTKSTQLQRRDGKYVIAP
jgi:hypothetical protein